MELKGEPCINSPFTLSLTTSPRELAACSSLSLPLVHFSKKMYINAGNASSSLVGLALLSDSIHLQLLGCVSRMPATRP